jgi:hypothetical protein
MGSQQSDRSGRTRRALRATIAALALSGGLLTAACSTDPGGEVHGSDGTVAVPRPAPTLAVEDGIEASEPVGPPADSDLVGIRRDCGQSVALGDGRALWLYCDTVLFDADGALELFLNTSSALAEPDAPLVMIDQRDRRGEPVTLIDPAPGYPPCEASQRSFTWPTAAAVVPDDTAGRDRVLIYFENVCVLPGEVDAYDVGVAEVVYDHDEPQDPNRPLRATVLEPRLFPRADRAVYGLAAVLDADGDHVNVYRCPASDDPCTVARAPVDDVADASAYRYWDGEGWQPEAAAAAPMIMPDTLQSTKASVEWVDDLGVYVMASHPVTETETVVLRAARAPEGPWSDPVEVPLPACAGFYPTICFAVEVHDHLSDAAKLGLTWFDPTYEPGGESPTRFAQVAVSVDGG